MPSGHVLDEGGLVDLGGREIPHLAAVAEDGDGIRDTEDLVQFMGDEHHADAPRLETQHDFQQPVDLLTGQGRGAKRTAVPETMRAPAPALAKTAAPSSARHAPTTA